jgi:hypothetical protein
MKLLLVVLLAVQPLAAFDTPLSEEAVREAYFLGQRHDESLTKALETYTQQLPVPDFGPHIAFVTCLTPFAQAVLLSSQQTANYSAQQAQFDHRHLKETVQVQIAIRFTNSYRLMIPANPSASPNDHPAFIPRPSDFWRDFDVAVFDGDKLLDPTLSTGRPDYVCDEGGCVLVGATILLQFPAQAFAQQNVTVHITPPEGDQVVTNFDLMQVR